MVFMDFFDGERGEDIEGREWGGMRNG